MKIVYNTFTLVYKAEVSFSFYFRRALLADDHLPIFKLLLADDNVPLIIYIVICLSADTLKTLLSICIYITKILMNLFIDGAFLCLIVLYAWDSGAQGGYGGS